MPHRYSIMATHVGGISDNLILDLFPALQTLLNQDLRTESQRLGGQVPQLLLVVREPGSKTSEGEGRTKDDGVANDLGSVKSGLNSRHGSGLGSGNVNLWQSKNI